MKDKEKNKDMPIGKITFMEDFLPGPKDLVLSDRSVKVSLYLSEPTVKAFKKLAKKEHTKYDYLISQVLDMYAKRYLIDS